MLQIANNVFGEKAQQAPFWKHRNYNNFFGISANHTCFCLLHAKQQLTKA
jgi:hypothetical protein